ncbi:MAG TPA: Gfo/Idh/MocA family oxidoreductase, partial [Microlunatus sp.]|nr:Gfo/Idh/MocA family oxidoreductase [Microlunatus sp.]
MLTTSRGIAELSALTVGLIGAGGIARVHAQCWLDLGVELRVWSDLPADDFVGAFPATSAPRRISAVADLAQLVADADVVDICSPTPSHLAYVRAAAHAGCHVI